MRHLVEPAIGTFLVLFVLVDIFLTVLYARMGYGILSAEISHLAWGFFRWASRPFRQSRARILSFCGPMILVLLILVWGMTLTCGGALVIHPYLGTSVRIANGPTPTDFVSALYAAGNSMAIVGSGEFSPSTPAFRILYVFNSLIGMSMLSLTLTYLMQIYNGLQRRNVLGLKIYLFTAQTGDAAELVAALGPGGHFASGYTNLSELAAEMANTKEAHHFYPVLFYFHFAEPYYSVAKSAFVALDTVALLKSALSNERYEWLKSSAAVTQLWEASLMLVKTLETTFLSGGLPEPEAPDAETAARWRRRYYTAHSRVRKAGIETVADRETGAEVYGALRSRWDFYVATLAHAMADTTDEIDSSGDYPAPLTAHDSPGVHRVE